MKIRNGFVSNSSSSSFIIVATKSSFDATMKISHEYIKYWINGMYMTTGKLNKEDIVLLETTICSEDGLNLWQYEGEVLNRSNDPIDVDRDDDGYVDINHYNENIMDESSAIYHFIKAMKKLNGENSIISSNMSQ